MPVKVILVALGVLLPTVFIAALVSTITTRLVLPSPEDAQPDSLPETATVDTPPVGVVLPSPEDAQPDRLSETATADTPRAGICGRTPEVQERLLDALVIDSCQVINADELYRLREFSVGARTVAPGDFADMPNLRVLTLRFQTWNPDEVGLPAGIFEGLTSLETLNIYTPTSGDATEPFVWALPHGTFADLPNLNLLRLDTGYGELLLDPETLTGLSNLEVLRLGNVISIAPGTFGMVPTLRDLRFRYPEGEVLPTDLIRDLPELRRVEVSGTVWPNRVAVASLETVCAMSYGGQWGSNSTVNGETPTLTVDGEAAKIILSDTRDRRIYCTIEHGQNEPKLAVADVA